MKLLSIIRSNVVFITCLALLATLYFSVDARTFLIRGLMRTGLYKANIENDRVSLLASNKWTLPEGVSLIGADGIKVGLSDQKGKLLFINFWAPWCPPCRAEMPGINALQNKLKDQKNIEFFMVDVDSKPKAATNYMVENELSLPVYSPSSFIPVEIFDGNLPTTVVISPEGKIIYHDIGAADYNHPDFLKFILANLEMQDRASIKP